MKNDVWGKRGRSVPLALLVTLMVQSATVVWWASARARDAVFLEQRVGRVEDAFAQRRKVDDAVLERLARIEERVSAQYLLLERMDKRASRRGEP